jgi:hypothetical protein
MGERRRVRHALVIEELVAFRGHQPAVEPEQLAELVRVVDLDALVRRLDRLEFGLGGVAVAGVRVEPVEHQRVAPIVGSHHPGRRGSTRRGGRTGGEVAALDAVDDLVLRPEHEHQRVEQLLRLAGVIGGEVAHVDIERHAAPLRPGVDRQVRLREQHGAGDAAGLALPLGENVILLVDDRQPGSERRVAAQLGQRLEIGQNTGAAGAVE